ncbi:3-carboxy-cis,cis-muconate cycloisomerase [Nocardioides anomalus]|uniref:3-carboxy-cis,cis-muconate cycloisomerase n=1 Tax=Nocardioides anomalus TaxID=2712223 RepID=A0A6G6WDN0_9ACTN|nr:lyase family protein [Nocardioides anomalus]QIG43319.1 3-carboxy-cis,cis-muconate cycloisomerase [Nocardioides anomalus]
MSELFWPGAHRAGALFSERAFLEAMVAVESAWIDAELTVPEGALDVESGGNPVIALVEALRTQHPGVHEGLTSQDVLDTALVLLLREAVAAVRRDLGRAVEAVDRLGAEHGRVEVQGRTLTQPALPITLGDRLRGWRAGLGEADADLGALTYPVQVGGPVGTTSEGRARLAERLGLADVPSWHTQRRAVTRAGDALVAATDACGHVARDVLAGSRDGTLSEASPGGSSSMPHKQNPVLSVLVRRAALTTPQLGATLHLAAADQLEERADGAWHAEWDTLRLLARRTAVAVSQTADLLTGLRVHP